MFARLAQIKDKPCQRGRTVRHGVESGGKDLSGHHDCHGWATLA